LTNVLQYLLLTLRQPLHLKANVLNKWRDVKKGWKDFSPSPRRGPLSAPEATG
jgi:hypothetical protein